MTVRHPGWSARAPLARLQAWPLIAALMLSLVPMAADAARPMKMRWHAQLQSQFHLAPAFDDAATDIDESADERTIGFRARRVRIWLDARRGPWKARAKVALDGGGYSWALVGTPVLGSTAEAKPVRLLSAWAQRELPWGLRVRAGQFKRRLSQDYLVTSTDLRLIERSIASEEVGSKRDIGAMLRGDWWRRRLVMQLLVLNGNGPNKLRNDNGNMRLEGRLHIDPIGRMNLEKARIGRKPKLRFGGAVATWRSNKRRKTNGYLLTDFDEQSAASALLAASWQGVELRAEVFWRWASPVDAEDPQRKELGYSDGAHQTALDEQARRRRGWYAQIAWRTPWWRKLEVAARAQQWWPDHRKPDTGSEAVDLGLTWRQDGDRVKLQTGWMALRQHRQDQADLDAWLWITQLQLFF